MSLTLVWVCAFVDVLTKLYTWVLARILSKWGTLVGFFLVLPALGSLQKRTCCCCLFLTTMMELASWLSSLRMVAVVLYHLGNFVQLQSERKCDAAAGRLGRELKTWLFSLSCSFWQEPAMRTSSSRKSEDSFSGSMEMSQLQVTFEKDCIFSALYYISSSSQKLQHFSAPETKNNHRSRVFWLPHKDLSFWTTVILCCCYLTCKSVTAAKTCQ